MEDQMKVDYDKTKSQQDLFPGSFRSKGEVLDSIPLRFGKYRGESPNKIANEDPGYIVWMYENVQDKHCSKNLYLACKEFLDEREDLKLDYLELDE
jgi:hypothetical protein